MSAAMLTAATSSRGLAAGLSSAALSARGMAASFAPLAALVGTAALLRSGEKFNRGMRESLAIMGDVSDAMRNQMRQAAVDTARVTLHSADQVGKAYYYLASAGMDAAQSVKALPQVAAFAQAGMFDMSRATELSTDAMHAMGMGSKNATDNLRDLARVTDVLIGANTLADATTEQFAISMTRKSAAAFRMVGKDIEEVVAVLAALGQRGIKAEEAGTQLSRLMIGLKNNAIRNAAAWRDLNVAVFDQTGDMRLLTEIIGDMETALGGMSDEQKQAAILALGFNKRNADVAAVLLGASGDIAEYTERLRDMGGITQEVAEKQLTPFQRGWAALSASFSDAGGRLMDWMGPGMEAAGKGMAKAIDWTRKALTGLGPVFEIIGANARALWDQMIEGFGIMGDWIGDIWEWLPTPFKSGVKTVVDYLDVMLGSVEGWGHSVVHLTSQTVLGFQAFWEETKSWFKIQWESLKGWWSDLWFDMSQEMVRQITPGLSRAMIEIQKWQAERKGEKWLLTPEEENEIIRSNTQAALSGLGNKQGASRAATDKKIQALREEREKKMAEIGQKSLDATEQYKKATGHLPKLSESLAAAFAAITTASGEGPAGPGAPGTPPGGAGGGATTARYAGAMERGSAEAYSTILNAGRDSRNIARDQLREARRTNEHLEDIARQEPEQTVSIGA
jgi:TP901 family phage tail tape measure protein